MSNTEDNDEAGASIRFDDQTQHAQEDGQRSCRFEPEPEGFVKAGAGCVCLHLIVTVPLLFCTLAAVSDEYWTIEEDT